MAVKCDFSGYATKNDVRCSDNKVIRHGAFAAYDGKTVPLVWQHKHGDVENVLGHADLEVREDGVYAYAHLNNTDRGRTAREMVKNGDIKAMSIYATHVRARGNDVVHGELVEVSLVLRGANPGALIDQVSIEHGDNGDEIEAVIYTDAQLDFVSHGDEDEDEDFEVEETDDVEHAEEESEADEAEGDEDDPTLGEIFEGMTEEQKTAVYAIVGQLVDSVDEEAEESETEEVEDTAHSDTTEDTMAHKNVFEGSSTTEELPVLTHAQVETIFEDARSSGSLKEAILAHAEAPGTHRPHGKGDARNIGEHHAGQYRVRDRIAHERPAEHHEPAGKQRTDHGGNHGNDHGARHEGKGERFHQVIQNAHAILPSHARSARRMRRYQRPPEPAYQTPAPNFRGLTPPAGCRASKSFDAAAEHRRQRLVETPSHGLKPARLHPRCAFVSTPE